MSLGQIHDDLHVIDGEEASLAVQGALEPVVVNAADECDDVALSEAKLTLVLRVKVVQSFGAGRTAS